MTDDPLADDQLADDELADGPDGPGPGLPEIVARTVGPQLRAPAEAVQQTAGEVLRAAPDVARVAALSSWRLGGWALTAAAQCTGYVVRRAVAGESAAAILQEAATDLRTTAWRALGLVGPGEPRGARGARASSADELRRRGADLLRRSNDVHVSEDMHPAFARILGEITPDEARILRFLYLDGPQPSIDVRTSRPLNIGSELVAGGLNMIAEHAGARYVDRIHPYLTNLNRLGLVEFSKEQVANPQRYQVVEAQPKVAEAMRLAGRLPKTVHRSIVLTEFGEDFCRTCLPIGTVRSSGRRPRPF